MPPRILHKHPARQSNTINLVKRIREKRNAG